jgi:hypothetical protein
MALAAVGCTGGDDDVSAADAAFEVDPTARHFPMTVGDTWSYDVTHLGGGSSGIKEQTVEAEETLTGAKAGVNAFRLRTLKPSGESTVSWQEDSGDALVRHLETSYDSGGVAKTDELYRPGKLRLDESAAHLEIGVKYTTVDTEDVTDSTTGLQTSLEKTEEWTVEAVDEMVTVPAGTFPCLRIRRVASPTNSDKRYWVARGVGKVREEGARQIEELRSFQVAN